MHFVRSMELRTATDIHIAEFAATHIQAKKADGGLVPRPAFLAFFVLFQSRDRLGRAREWSGGRVSQAYSKEVRPKREVPGSLGSYPRFPNSRLGTRGTSGNARLSLRDDVKVKAENIRNR